MFISDAINLDSASSKKHALTQLSSIVLQNFSSKYGITLFTDLKVGYEYLPYMTVWNRNKDKTEFRKSMHDFNSNFWYDEKGNEQYWEEGLAVFELAREYMWLNSTAKQFAQEIGLEKIPEGFELTQSSLDLLADNSVSLLNYFLYHEVVIGDEFMSRSNALIEARRDFSGPAGNNPSNADILRGAYAALLYGFHDKVNSGMERTFAKEDLTISEDLLLPVPTTTALVEKVSDMYQNRSFTYRSPNQYSSR